MSTLIVRTDQAVVTLSVDRRLRAAMAAVLEGLGLPDLAESVRRSDVLWPTNTEVLALYRVRVALPDEARLEPIIGL